MSLSCDERLWNLTEREKQTLRLRGGWPMVIAGTVYLLPPAIPAPLPARSGPASPKKTAVLQ